MWYDDVWIISSRIIFFYDNVDVLQYLPRLARFPLGKSLCPWLMRCGLILIESIGTEAEILVHVNPLKWKNGGRSTTALRPGSTPRFAAVPTLVKNT